MENNIKTMYIYLTDLFCCIEVNTVSQQYFNKTEKKENTKIRMKKKVQQNSRPHLRSPESKSAF